MTRENFKMMINDFMADHADEYEDDPLVLGLIERDDDLGWICYAEDSKSCYILHDGGSGNITIDYAGTK